CVSVFLCDGFIRWLYEAERKDCTYAEPTAHVERTVMQRQEIITKKKSKPSSTRPICLGCWSKQAVLYIFRHAYTTVFHRDDYRRLRGIVLFCCLDYYCSASFCKFDRIAD